MVRQVIPLASKKNTPCRFFAIGDCRKGDKCKFSHEMTTEVENSQATTSETITKKNKKKKKPKQQRSCSTCSKVSDRLVLGLQSLDKIALAFVTLQEELKLAQSTLYETKLDMNKAIQELENSEVEEEECSMIDERDETNIGQDEMVEESISTDFTSASDIEGKKAGVVQQSEDANNVESTERGLRTRQ